MINGYDDLYSAKDGQPPKYRIIPSEALIHYVFPDVLAKSTPTGLGAFENYTSLVEQNVGEDVYKLLYALDESYKHCIELLLVYQHDMRFFKDKKAEFKEINDKIAVVDKEINAAVPSSKNTPEENERILNLNIELIKLQRELESIRQVMVEPKQDQVVKALVTLTKLLAEARKSKKSIDDADKLFKDSKFEDTLEQDYVDSMLLPGAENQEKRIRTDAHSKFLTMKVEMDYLQASYHSSRKLLSNLSEYRLEESITQEQYIRYRQGCCKKSISTDVIGVSSSEYTTNPAFSSFYSYIIETYSSNAQVDTNDLYKIGIEKFGIPATDQKPMVAFINRVLGKNKVGPYVSMEYMGITSFNSIIENIDTIKRLDKKATLSI